MAYFKDDPAFKTIALAPARPVAPPASGALRAVANTYNRIGGITDRLAQVIGIDPFVVLTVWMVESGGKAFIAGQPIIRFENHQFFNKWGNSNATSFDRHFQFGGRAGVSGKSWQNHKFRNPANSAWRAFHNIGQDKEYEVYNFAVGLAGTEASAYSTSWGGPQIMGFNHPTCGYGSATALATSFSSDERWQAIGFFDFCQHYRHGVLIGHIKNKRWLDVATIYNGDPSPNGYAKRFKDTFDLKSAFDALPRTAAAALREAVAHSVHFSLDQIEPSRVRTTTRRARMSRPN